MRWDNAIDNWTNGESNLVAALDLEEIEVGDVDNDGDIDIVSFSSFASSGNEVELWLNGGSGNDRFGTTATNGVSVPFGTVFTDAVLNDFDNDDDHDLDIAAATDGSQVLTFDFSNGGFGEEVNHTSFGSGARINVVLAFDIDNDGYTDIAVAIDSTDNGGETVEIAVLENAIPEFTTLLAPIVSVIGIVLWNYRRRQPVEQ